MSTIVGSWPHRRALPEGREALERAMRCCLRRCRAFRRGAALCTPANACDIAYRGAPHADAWDELCTPARACWLPERYRSMTVTALREELRKLDEAAP